MLNEFRFSRRQLVSSQFCGGVLDGLDDVIVTGAAAQVPGNTPPDLLLGRIGIFFQQFHGPHQHTRGAETAVEPVILFEAFLKGMHFTRRGQPFHRGNVFSISLNGQNGAGFYRFAVQQYSTSAATGRITTDMGTGEIKFFPDEMNQ